MKTTHVLTFLLVVSLAYNAYQYTMYKALSIDEVPGVCIKTDPYNTAITIERDAAREFYTEFTTSLTSPDSITGGVISRAAFDEMFCMEKCNGLTYSFARDKSGKTGPGGNGIFIIFQGANIEYDYTGDSIKAVYAIDGAKMYRSGNWCPLNCMAW
jgi:hypothetical protein